MTVLLHATPLAVNAHANSALEEEQEIFPIKYWWSENERRLSDEAGEVPTHTHTLEAPQTNPIKKVQPHPYRSDKEQHNPLLLSFFTRLFHHLASFFLAISLSSSNFTIPSICVSLFRSLSVAALSVLLSPSQQQGWQRWAVYQP